MKDILTAICVFWTITFVCAGTAAFEGVPWPLALSMSIVYCSLGGIVGLLVGIGFATYIAHSISRIGQ